MNERNRGAVAQQGASDARKWPMLAAFGVGILALLTPVALLGESQSGAALGVFAFVVAVGALFLADRTEPLTWRTPVGLLSGIAIAVIAQALIDLRFGTADHSLLPLEVPFYWAVAAGPLAAGFALAMWRRRRRSRGVA